MGNRKEHDTIFRLIVFPCLQMRFVSTFISSNSFYILRKTKNVLVILKVTVYFIDLNGTTKKNDHFVYYTFFFIYLYNNY